MTYMANSSSLRVGVSSTDSAGHHDDPVVVVGVVLGFGEPDVLVDVPARIQVADPLVEFGLQPTMEAVECLLEHLPVGFPVGGDLGEEPVAVDGDVAHGITPCCWD